MYYGIDAEVTQLDANRINPCVTDLIEASSYYVDSTAREKCLTQVRDGSRWPVLCLLLTLLPDLERLCLGDLPSDEGLESFLVSPLVSGPTSTILRNLHTIECSQTPRDHDNISIYRLAHWSLVPSVRAIKSCHTIDNGSAWMKPEYTTQLQSIEIAWGNVPCLSFYATHWVNLREFRYHHADHSTGGVLDSAAIVKALQMNVGDSLEVLSISFPDGLSTAVKSFVGFKVCLYAYIGP